MCDFINFYLEWSCIADFMRVSEKKVCIKIMFIHDGCHVI